SVAYLARQIIWQRTKRYIPIITTLHGTDITLVGNDPSYSPVVEFSMNQSDGLTAVSHFLKEKTQKLFNMNNAIEVIHNLIDYDRFQIDEKVKESHRIAEKVSYK